MKSGAIKLKDYIKAKKLEKVTQIDIAKSIGCSRSYLVQLITDKKTPSIDMAIRIETITGIKFKEWGVEA